MCCPSPPRAESPTSSYRAAQVAAVQQVPPKAQTTKTTRSLKLPASHNDNHVNDINTPRHRPPYRQQVDVYFDRPRLCSRAAEWVCPSLVLVQPRPARDTGSSELACLPVVRRRRRRRRRRGRKPEPRAPPALDHRRHLLPHRVHQQR